jgi:hypothetical protein
MLSIVYDAENDASTENSLQSYQPTPPFGLPRNSDVPSHRLYLLTEHKSVLKYKYLFMHSSVPLCARTFIFCLIWLPIPLYYASNLKYFRASLCSNVMDNLKAYNNNQLHGNIRFSNVKRKN